MELKPSSPQTQSRKKCPRKHSEADSFAWDRAAQEAADQRLPSSRRARQELRDFLARPRERMKGGRGRVLRASRFVLSVGSSP